MTVIGPSTGGHVPNEAVFDYSDHAGVTVDAEKARFLRPLDYGTLKHFTPCARARFRSDAPNVTVRLRYNNLHPSGYYYDIVSVLVDGAPFSDHNPADSRTVFDYDIVLNFGTSDFRTIEVVFPYAAAVDFVGVQQHPRYRLSACRPRPHGKLLAIGDSITNGFYVTQARNSWPFLLANMLGLQCVNMGFAGAYSNSHGTGSYVAGMDDIEVAVVMLGTNDAAAAVNLDTYQANMEALIGGVLSHLSPTAKMIVASPIWADWPPELNLASYRARAIAAAVAVDDDRITTVDGLTLCTNSTAHVPDGVHPGDAGSAAMAANLAALLG